MKIILVKTISTLCVMVCVFLSMHSYAGTNEKDHASTSNGVRICPGSGSCCILWGLVYKGSDNSHVEPMPDEESQPTHSDNQ